MIVRDELFTMLKAQGRVVLARERAALDCGCLVWVGLRSDNFEPATVSVVCERADHTALLLRFRRLFLASLVDPTDRPLVDVTDELLHQAAAEHAQTITSSDHVAGRDLGDRQDGLR